MELSGDEIVAEIDAATTELAERNRQEISRRPWCRDARPPGRRFARSRSARANRSARTDGPPATAMRARSAT
jgi:hypothetical protein